MSTDDQLIKILKNLNVNKTDTSFIESQVTRTYVHFLLSNTK